MATTTKTAAKKATAKKTTATPDMMSIANSTEWTAAAKEQFETMMTAFGGNFDEMREKAEGYAEETQARMKTVQDRAAETNALLMEAAQEEVSSAVNLASELGAAKSFADALTIQQNYWTKLFETRMERARTVTEASVDAARETMTPVEMPFGNFGGFEKFFAFPAKA